VDVVLGDCGGVQTIEMAERVTLEARDLGVVRDREGGELGRVVAIDGDLVTWELSSGGQGSARVPEEYGAR
jgi:hypothetical protein